MKSESRLPRRAFLGQITVLGLAGLAGAGKWIGLLSWGRNSRPAIGLSLEKVTCGDFAQCLGSTFRFRAETGKPFEMTLVQAHELRSSSASQRGMRQPFSLIFRGESSTPPAAQIYQVEHRRLGTFAMYLGPVNRPASGVRLEAVFG